MGMDWTIKSIEATIKAPNSKHTMHGRKLLLTWETYCTASAEHCALQSYFAIVHVDAQVSCQATSRQRQAVAIDSNGLAP